MRARLQHVLLEVARRATRSGGPGMRGRVAAARLALRATGAPHDLRLAGVVEHADVATRLGTLHPAEDARVAAPLPWQHAATGPAGVTTAKARAIRWSLVEDVVLNDTSLVLTRDGLVCASGGLEDVARGHEFKGPGLQAHGGRAALVEPGAPLRSEPAGIRLCGFGSGNWYHWLVEILPAATLLDALPDDLRDLPVLVPEAVAERPAWRDALSTVLPGRRAIPVPRHATLHVDRLVWIDPVVHGPSTLRDGHRPALDLLVPSTSVLQRFRALVLERLGVRPEVEAGRRVLLVRPPDAKRAANQDELIAVARAHGFTPVDPGTLPFREQVRLFATAEVVAGGWGAAWSSMLFATPDTRGLMWAPRLFADWPLFANLAPVSEMTLRHLFVPTADATFRTANSAVQHVPPDEFAEALDALGARGGTGSAG